MKLMCNLNSYTYLSDLKEIGVEALVLGNSEISSRHAIESSLDKMLGIAKNFNVYVLMNELYTEEKLAQVHTWLDQIAPSKIAGVIFQDFAVLAYAKKIGMKQDLMYAPETLNTNHETLNDLHQLGVTSAFLAREIPLEDVEKIAQHCPLPLMVQVHGVMYMSQSRRPLLTNYANSLEMTLDAKPYTLKAKNSEVDAWIFEDSHGCHIMTKEELSALDLMASLNTGSMEWCYVDCQMMDDYRALEIVSLYHDAVLSLNKGTFLKDVHAYRPILNSLMKNQKRSTGFYNDGTVYKLEDVRMKDNEKRNQ